MLADQNITASLSPEARAKLALDGYSFELVARPIQRIIEREVINRLSVEIITGALEPGDSVVIGVKNDQYTFVKQE
jgi:ATP-dependent Clp protease ATP-binding subunit ClpA